MVIVTISFRVQHTYTHTHTHTQCYPFIRCYVTDVREKASLNARRKSARRNVTYARSFQRSFWPQTYAYGVSEILVEQEY